MTVAVQFIQFLDAYRTRGPERLVLFDAGVKPLLQQAFASGKTIYIDYDDRGAQAQARWHAAEAGVPSDRIAILPDGGIPPRGSTVFWTVPRVRLRVPEIRPLGALLAGESDWPAPRLGSAAHASRPSRTRVGDSLVGRSSLN